MSRSGKSQRGPFAGVSAHIWALHISLFLDPRYWRIGRSKTPQFPFILDIVFLRILWEINPDRLPKHPAPPIRWARKTEPLNNPLVPAGAVAMFIGEIPEGWTDCTKDFISTKKAKS